jgi:16S rRNA (uracil1498-N3)-methyltransferase
MNRREGSEATPGGSDAVRYRTGRRACRVFVDRPLETGRDVLLEGTSANHVARVLRLRVADPLTLFDGHGGEYQARVAELRRDSVLVNVGEHRATERESPLHISLAQGISRGERMDWVVQKATELGVTRIAPLFTERSVVHLDDKQASRKIQHWRSIAISACEQCGRNRIPQIDPPVGVFELLERHPRDVPGVLLSPDATRRIDPTMLAGKVVTVLIGPEGGLSEVEQETALRRGFMGLRMGPRILRTETAAVCALTLLQQTFGDL